MKILLLLVLFLIPIPVKSQVWKEFYREKIKSGSSWYEYSRDIDPHSITKRDDYYYVNVRYWSSHPLSSTSPTNQSIFAKRISCKNETIQNVEHNNSNWGEGVLYKRFPNSQWKYYDMNGWENSSTDEMDLLMIEVCGK